MSLGHASVIRSDYEKALQAKIARIKRAYEAAMNVADQTMQNMVPVDKGNLKASTKAESLTDRIGFVMRSFGDQSTGKAYARWVNGGHNIALAAGGVRFVSGVPFFSQAEADARAVLRRELTSR